MEKIFIHLPAYREPELIPTIENALKEAKHPERLVFGICRQYHPDDGFDNLDKYRKDPRFKIHDMLYSEAKGLATARAIINDTLLEDEDFVLQLDSHHRFKPNFDETLIKWYNELKEDGYNPLIGGYLPYYNPFNDPQDRTQVPWFTRAECFYPFNTIFIRPTGYRVDISKSTKPVPGRFISGHFCFGTNKWAKEVKHDPNIFFAGEEINITVRSYTHGYDIFNPHEVVIWHATMREERAGKLVWDDQSKTGKDLWWKGNDIARSRIRQLLNVGEEAKTKPHDLTGYELGKVRTLRDYEKYAGIHFEKMAFQKETINDQLPPNPQHNSDKEWEDSFIPSFYYSVNITPQDLPSKDYNFILLAFDDENGVGVESEFIDDGRLKHFINNKRPIHFEKMFYPSRPIKKVVYWGHSEKRGWAEKKEIYL